MILSKEECPNGNPRTFIYFYKLKLDNKYFFKVSRVRESKEAQIQNNARPRFECLLMLCSSIETLVVAATWDHRKARTLFFSNIIEALWRWKPDLFWINFPLNE